MLQAYNTKAVFSVNYSNTANGVTVTYNMSFDFANCQGQNVIGIICGHVHRDIVIEKTSSNVLAVATTCDRYGYEDEPATYTDGQGNVYERTPGTVREQAFDVVHIDLENRKVYFTRFGGGFDREYDF